MCPAVVEFTAFDRHVLGGRSGRCACKGGGGDGWGRRDDTGVMGAMESGVTSSEATNTFLIAQLEFGFE